MNDQSLGFQASAAEILDQSLAKIRHCLSQLTETQVWWRPDPAMNSIGNLLMHLNGNLRQWGVTPFTLARDERNRDEEFDPRVQESSAALLQRLEATVHEAQQQWQHLSDDQLTRMVTIQGFNVSHLHAIMHTSSHFVGHTHQIVQLSRLLLRTSYRFHWTPAEDRGDVPV